MKSRKFSTLLLPLGLLIGLLALSVGSTPIAGMTGSVIGGFTDYPADGVYVAATSTSCAWCPYTVSRPCSEYTAVRPDSCWGGYVSVAYCSAGATTHAGALSVCTGSHPWCTDLYDAMCY